MKTIDLHTHSTVSDGTLTPEELINYAISKHLSAIALTDHDSVDGLYSAAQAASRHCQFELIDGIEVSVFHKGTEIHILGLYIEKENINLINFLKDLKIARHNRNIQMIQLMNKNGVAVSMEELTEVKGNASVLTRVHFGHLLVQKGYAVDLNEAFKKYLSIGCPTYVPRTLVSGKDAINIIHKAGGLAFMAHPSLYRTTQLTEIIKDFINLGMDGIEAIYATYTTEEESYFKQLAKKYNILITGGSDFHGENKKGLDLGCGYGQLSIPYNVLENIKRVKDLKNA